MIWHNSMKDKLKFLKNIFDTRIVKENITVN